MPDKELALFLAGKGLPNKDQWPEAATAGKLAVALKKIRNDGLVISRSKLVGIGFPLYEKGKVVAALGLFLQGAKLTRTHKAHILARMAEAARAISDRLSGA
jgi:DNA-binding IclR family transcriptional regulator